jgi:uncharacterized protein YneR
MKKALESSEESEYEKPQKTFTERLTKKEIEDYMIDYEKTDIKKIALGTHVRYFEKVNGDIKFRIGGNLMINNGLPKYVVLTNGRTNWSVQVKDCIFFAKLNSDKMKIEYEEQIENLKFEVAELKSEIRKKDEISKDLSKSQKKYLKRIDELESIIEKQKLVIQKIKK